MTGWLNKLNYMHKLTLSSMLSSLLAVLTVLTIVVVITFNAARNDLVENLQTTASLLGASANASISLKDPAYANNALNTLVNQNHVIEAKIFTPGNQAENESSVVASYKNDLLFNQSDISPQLKFNPAKQDPLISQNEILISEPVFNGNQVIASISILASLQPLYDRLKLIVLFSLLALAMATLISFVIWRSTQQTWARPFVKFSRAIQYVIQEKDYSKRIKVTTKDDLGEMISGFNTLMTQIQAAQLKLKNQQATLEYEVEARTEELTRANRKLISEVAERSKTEINLSKLSRAVAQAEESVIITDNEGKIEYVNPSFEKITGYKKSQAIGSNASLLRSDYHDDDFYNDLWDTLARGKVYKGVFINSRPDGNEYHFEQSITPMRNQHGMITHFVATGRDISERIQNEEALQFMAHHDALTSLPNRSLLSDRIERALARAKRERTEVAIMFIDLDGFKMANDMYGHEAGDVVLKSVASRLRSTIRSQDTVARLSGDEFAVMIEDLQNVSDAGIVARKILDSLALPHEHGNEEIFVTASIGISIFPGDGKNARVLLKHADQAMYQAKFKGKARYSFYSKKINANETQRMQKEQALIRAVKEKQFVLHYQPLMHTDQKGMHGVEALIRWQHPKEGMVMPDQFIPSLEDSGMINEVGAWVMEEACLQLAKWHQNGHPNLVMSINVSPRQFNDKNFLNYLINALQVSGIPHQTLEIEITERAFLALNNKTLRILQKISDLGVRLAVDDFGMGHSSLSYISKLPINTLKIDRSFISDLAHSQENAKIVSALIGLGERLDINVTAEGVETLEQLLLLEDLKCTFAQGWLFSKAMSPGDFENWVPGSTTQRLSKLEMV